MSKREKVIPSLKELRADMKGMSLRQKLDHLWTYYKEYLLVLFVVVLALAATVTGLINTSKDVLVSGIMANISITQKGYNYLSQDYEEVLGAKANEIVELTYTNFTSLADPNSAEDNYTAAQILSARVSGGLLDYAIVDQLAFEFYITQEVFLDLRELFTQEELQALADKDMLVYGAYEDSPNERRPMAIKISQLPFCKDTVSTKGEIYFTVSGNQPDKDAVRGIWEHLNAWKE